jgi:hypothetical protein
MNSVSTSRQPSREAWSDDRLLFERAVALGCSIEPSSAATYSSAFRLYLAFCHLHNRSIEPTLDTLSFYIVFMCYHIKPQSVESYLTGICSMLEASYPNVRDIRRHRVVTRCLAGCKKLYPGPVVRKCPLTRAEVGVIVDAYSGSLNYEDHLFTALLTVGFHGLFRLGELVWPDSVLLRDHRKVIHRSSTKQLPCGFSLFLPGHKADRFFEGSTVILQQISARDDPYLAMQRYISFRDVLFPFNYELWLRPNGHIPTRAWFIARLRQHFPSEVAGHSLRSGGATALAESGVPHHIIQAIGRWSSEAFKIYIRKHPVLLHASLDNSS